MTNKVDNERLAVCPWHGTNDDLDIQDNQVGCFWVICTKHGCGCEGPYAHSVEDAIAAWNTRASAGVVVKPLEWSNHDSHSEITYTEFGPYLVEKVGDDGFSAWTPDETKNARIMVQGFTSRDAARSHCQKNLASRRAISSVTATAALQEAERFMAYFAGETDGVFFGPGTPKSCLGIIRAALTPAAPQAVGEVVVKHADDCQWDKPRLTLARKCTCGALVPPQPAAVPDGLKELQEWVAKQQLDLLPLDPHFHTKHDTLRAVRSKIRSLIAAAPLPKAGE